MLLFLERKISCTCAGVPMRSVPTVYGGLVNQVTVTEGRVTTFDLHGLTLALGEIAPAYDVT